MNEIKVSKQEQCQEPQIANESTNNQGLQERNQDDKKPARRNQNRMVAEKTSDMYFSGLMSE